MGGGGAKNRNLGVLIKLGMQKLLSCVLALCCAFLRNGFGK